MELDQKVRVRKTVMVKVRVKAKALAKDQRLAERKEIRKKPKSQPDLRTRIERLRTIA